MIGEACCHTPSLGYIVVGPELDVSVVKIIQFVVVALLIIRDVDVIVFQLLPDTGTGDAVPVSHLELYIAILFAVIGIADRYVEIKLVVLEQIAKTGGCLNQTVRSKVIAEVQLHLVIDSFPLAISHIQRIEDRGDTEITLVVRTEMTLDAVHEVITDSIPQNCLGHILLAYLLGRQTAQGVDRIALVVEDSQGRG